MLTIVRSPGKNVTGRASKDGDYAIIDFEGFKDGTPFTGGKGENHPLLLGSGSFIPGFEEQVVGMKAGDNKTITVTFPAEYHSSDLAGKEVEFKVTLHDIKEAASPKVDEDFAKSLGFKTLDDARKVVGERVKEDFDQAVHQHLKKQLFDELDKQCKFTSPPGMIEVEFNTIWQNVDNALKADKDAFDKPEKELRKEYEEVADRRVRLGLFLAETGNRNNLQITTEDIQRAVMDEARQYPGMESQVIAAYQQHPHRLEELKGVMIENKAVDFILDKVKYNDTSMSLDDIRALFDESDDDTQKPSSKKTSKKSAAKKKSA